MGRNRHADTYPNRHTPAHSEIKFIDADKQRVKRSSNKILDTLISKNMLTSRPIQTDLKKETTITFHKKKSPS